MNLDAYNWIFLLQLNDTINCGLMNRVTGTEALDDE